MGAEALRVALDELFGDALELGGDRRLEPVDLRARLRDEGRKKMGSVCGEGMGARRQRLEEGGLEGGGEHENLALELSQEPVALFPEPLTIAARMDELRGVRQHREGRALRPRELVGGPTEVAPRGRLQPHDVAAKRGVAPGRA